MAPHMPHGTPFAFMTPHLPFGAPYAFCKPHPTPWYPSEVHILIPMTKGQDKRSQFHHHCHHPTFFLQQKKKIVGSQKGPWCCKPRWNTSVHILHSWQVHWRFEATPHSFVWSLKRVPLLNCHMDHDRPSSVCPSPRYREVWRQKAFFSPLGCILLHVRARLE